MMKLNQHKCMMDSYSVLTGKSSYEEMLEKDDQTAFIFNPTLPVVSMEDDVFDVLIEYFSGIEDYEKCAELVQHKKVNSFCNSISPLEAYKNGRLASQQYGNQKGKNISNL